ncbi:uncharacterized protein ACIB01_010008 [Guaruba guarouba]
MDELHSISQFLGSSPATGPVFCLTAFHGMRHSWPGFVSLSATRKVMILMHLQPRTSLLRGELGWSCSCVPRELLYKETLVIAAGTLCQAD